MGIEWSLSPVAAVSSISSVGRGRPFSGGELAGGGGRGDRTLLLGSSSACLPAGLARAVPLSKGAQYEDVVPTRSVLNTQRTVMRGEAWAARWHGQAVSCETAGRKRQCLLQVLCCCRAGASRLVSPGFVFCSSPPCL